MTISWKGGRRVLGSLGLGAALAFGAAPGEAAQFCAPEAFVDVNVLFGGIPAPPVLGFGGEVTCDTFLTELEFEITLADDDTIALEFLGDLDSDLGGAGFVFADTGDLIDPFRSVSLRAPDFVGLGDSAVSLVSGNEIRLQFDGVTGILQGAEGRPTVLLDVGFGGNGTGVIPLPATLPLLLGGFGTFLAFGRRRGAG